MPCNVSSMTINPVNHSGGCAGWAKHITLSDWIFGSKGSSWPKKGWEDGSMIGNSYCGSLGDRTFFWVSGLGLGFRSRVQGFGFRVQSQFSKRAP